MHTPIQSDDPSPSECDGNARRARRSIAAALLSVAMLLSAAEAQAAKTNYVWRNNPTPPAAPPYDSWTNAAVSIQAAVNAAVAGDTVLVTNGTYDTGGSAGLTEEGVTSRVYAAMSIVIRSVEGPAATIIQGSPDPGTGTWGTNAVRGACVKSGAVLAGFTLTNGYTGVRGAPYTYDQYGGGVFCRDGGTISNCVIVGNSAAYSGGGVYMRGSGTVTGTIISRNRANNEGAGMRAYDGAGQALVSGCTVVSNYGGQGSGVYVYSGVTLNDCTVSANTNFGSYGPGVYLYNGGTASRCTLSGNRSNTRSCGLYIELGGTANSCLVVGNTSQGVYMQSGGALNNCTIVTNSGWGLNCPAVGGAAANCIIWGNTSGNISSAGTVIYTCATPKPTGAGNIESDPMFVNTAAGDYRLRGGSLCVNAGTNGAWTVGALDRDGKRRIHNGKADMGAYEFVARGTVVVLH